ncbi:hypothetical protein pipiens_009164 [Culex pipiens pipiens]|uniref:Uncharacterized protein n=1 Tax=Culex pipiens pipiens TaxID=38569 RepID=A0ABD1DF16_CULPP
MEHLVRCSDRKSNSTPRGDDSHSLGRNQDHTATATTKTTSSLKGLTQRLIIALGQAPACVPRGDDTGLGCRRGRCFDLPSQTCYREFCCLEGNQYRFLKASKNPRSIMSRR